MKPSLLGAARSSPRDSLRWMRWDFPLRIVPLIAAPLLLAAQTPLPVRTLGLTLTDMPQQVLLSAALGPPIGWVAWWYRRRFVGRMVVPTTSDALFQSVYYVVLNSPAEEIFFRGMLLGWLKATMGPFPAWLLSTLVFGLYHVPAGWGWRAVGGVTVAGGLFGVLFLAGSGGGSLTAPTLVHAFATCGFLSAGPWAARTLKARSLKAGDGGVASDAGEI